MRIGKHMKKTSILLIDDDTLFLSLTRSALKKVPFLSEVEDLNDVKEARRYLDSCMLEERPCPDVIFLDINLPGIGGLDFAEMYSRRYAEKFPKTRLVILSSSNSYKDRKAAMSIPAVDDYIEKPLTKEKLNRVLLD